METTGSVGITCPGAMPAEMDAPGPTMVSDPDVNQVLVVERHPAGTAGRRRRPCGRSVARAGRRDRSPRGRPRPPRPRAPGGTGAAAAVPGGSGPNSRTNGRWCRPPPRHGGPAGCHISAGVECSPCSPSHRTAAPTPWTPRHFSRSRARPPPIPPALRTRGGRVRRRHPPARQAPEAAGTGEGQARLHPTGRCRGQEARPAASSCPPRPG